MQITLEYLTSRVEFLAAATGKELYIEYAYGKPRIFEKLDRGSREVSPRLSEEDLVHWIDAYQDGIEAVTPDLMVMARALTKLAKSTQFTEEDVDIIDAGILTAMAYVK